MTEEIVTENTVAAFSEVLENEAMVNITYGGANGDMSAPIALDSSEEDIKQWVTEAVRSGSVPGISADAEADFTDFVIDRFPPSTARPHHLVGVRPKTPYGA